MANATASDVDPYAATESLRAALTDVGMVLPSLGVDVASDMGLVNLGRARAEVISRLADVIRRGGGKA
ncbi:hypothetical protein [Streptomyces phaeochromogenes]|uniref:hypothetical protein n=1 Tax=Streptomyces phaeochromogenes TaxID=1923 RepID=UPI003865C9FB|nr:hypothetical protein OG277_06595 [Streptomyces phaeochromogenes]